ncbi:MAG: beta strand repeat-containing protein [Rhizomicrobium sp.]
MAINNVTFAGLDPNLLLSLFQAKQPVATAAQTTAAGTTTAKTGATAKDLPPWQAPSPSQQAQDAKVLATTNFLNTSNVPLGATTTADAKTEQDNQKLFSLYTAVNTLSYLAKIAGRDTTPSGQLASLNARFQQGLQQIQSFIANTTFNNFTLQAAAQTSNITSTAGIQFGSFTYDTRTLTGGASVNAPLAGLSASDSFTIAVTKDGTTTNVAIDLSQVQGGLSLGNIVSYVNQQLSAGGFTTRFQKVLTSGSLETPSTATFGLQVSPSGNETISLSAAATPSLYLAGNTGTAIGTATTAADQQGRLIKLTNLGTTPNSVFNASVAPTNGTSSAQATQVDASGNVYVIGSATGSFGNQLNQGTQDAYLTKYDSAGNVQWTKLLGSTGTASGFSLALNPAGGVVVTGSTTSDLVQGAVADGNNDSFVAKYDANGNQTWVKQLQTLSNNQANAVSVDSSGNVYIGGQVASGSIGKGQTSQGSSDAYVAKLDTKGNIVYEKQFGTSGKDQVSATATAADGSLYVASVQNGHAIVSKYANGDATAAPVWQSDLGDLQAGGAIGGLTVSGNQLYVSGTTQNGNLTAGGAATVANASSSGTDAFVFNLTDSGSSATPDFVSYVGTGSTDKGGAVTVGSDGTIYLTGSTTGTFAGQNRNVASVSNQFAASLTANGSVNWTHQFGGVDGQSSGAGIAIDTSGASVLDALGLPRGTITLNQSVDLTSQTTLRAGDSFQIQLEGTAARTATVTIEQGETLQSLATKINIQLQTNGKASVSFNKGGEGLKIAVNPGVTAKLIAGPADFDALARLGITPGTLTSASTSTSSTSGTTKATTQAFGLGLGNSFDLSTKTGANLARSQLLGVLSAVQTAYQKTNAPATPATGPGITNGSVSPYLQSKIAAGNLALSLLA